MSPVMRDHEFGLLVVGGKIYTGCDQRFVTIGFHQQGIKATAHFWIRLPIEARIMALSRII